MVSLRDLAPNQSIANEHSGRQPPTASLSSPPQDVPRLTYLISRGLLPPYLKVLTASPTVVDENPYSEQARREWPRVAHLLSLPEGQVIGPLTHGIAIALHEGLALGFDINQLWRTLFEEQA